MAAFVVQLYSALADFIAGVYPAAYGAAPDALYPIIVTLEDWHLLGDPIWQWLHASIQHQFAVRGLDPDLLERHPFTVAWIDEFKELAQRAAGEGIASVLGPKMADPEHRSWSLGSFFQNVPTAQRYPLLFEEELEALVERAREL